MDRWCSSGRRSRARPGSCAESAGHAPIRLARCDPERLFLLQLAPRRADAGAPGVGTTWSTATPKVPIKPQLATSWQYADDTSLEFELRPTSPSTTAASSPPTTSSTPSPGPGGQAGLGPQQLHLHRPAPRRSTTHGQGPAQAGVPGRHRILRHGHADPSEGLSRARRHRGLLQAPRGHRPLQASPRCTGTSRSTSSATRATTPKARRAAAPSSQLHQPGRRRDRRTDPDARRQGRLDLELQRRPARQRGKMPNLQTMRQREHAGQLHEHGRGRADRRGQPV